MKQNNENLRGLYLPHLKILFIKLIPLVILFNINFLYFHIIVEAYTIAIGVTIFVITLNTRRYYENSFFTIIGISFLSVAFIDFIHSLTYKGMTVFSLNSANMATQYWIYGRYVQSISIFLALFFITKKINFYALISAYAIVTSLAPIMIGYNIFPTSYIDGVGQSNFKIISEFIVVVIFLYSFHLIGKFREYFGYYVYHMLRAGILLSALTEIVFTLYIDVYSITNATGHVFKMSAFYFFYRACVYATLNKPIESIFHDINESKRFLINILESLTYPFYVVDVKTKKIKLANSATNFDAKSNLTCYSALYNNCRPCSPNGDSCVIDVVKETKRPLVTEISHIGSDKKEKIIELHVYPIINNNGEVEKIIEYCFDITDKKRQKEQINKLSVAIEHSSNSIIITDTKGTIEYVNKSFCDITGYSSDEIIGQDLSIIKSGFINDEIYENLLMSINKGKVWHGEICNKKKNGELIWQQLTMTPLKDPSGKATHYIGILEDITDRIRAELAEKKAEETEKKVLELEKELESLDRLIGLHQPTITARFYGNIPIRESMPELFNELVNSYKTLFKKYLESQVYKTEYDIVEHMKQYIDNLGSFRAGPRELIDLHTTALKIITKELPYEKAQAYVNEGKILLIELMGYFVSFYRNYFIMTSKKTKEL